MNAAEKLAYQNQQQRKAARIILGTARFAGSVLETWARLYLTRRNEKGEYVSPKKRI